MEKQIQCYNSGHFLCNKRHLPVPVSIVPENVIVFNLNLSSNADTSSLNSLISIIVSIVDLAMIQTSSD